MPVYNSEATLHQAIQSILSQTYDNLSLVIVDDASTDLSLDIAKSYLYDKRVKVYSNKTNMGAYYCRNFGLYMSRNQKWKYFTTHDADDVSFDHRYKVLVRLLNKHEDVYAMQDAFERIEMGTGRVLSANVTMAHAIFRRKVFDHLGYFDNVRFGGDWEYWTRLNIWQAHSSFRTRSYVEVMGESYIGTHNLTVQIPENSSQRTEYMTRVKRKFRFGNHKDIKYSFTPIPHNGKRISRGD